MPAWEQWLSTNWKAEQASRDARRSMSFGELLKLPASSSSMKMAAAPVSVCESLAARDPRKPGDLFNSESLAIALLFRFRLATKAER
jgi:hypothetical protein